MAVSVDVATYAGTAVAGVNYTPLDQVLSFAAGQDSQTVTIPVRNDGVVTPDLTASVVLSSPTSGVSLGTPSTMTLVIHNVDQNAGTTGTGSTSNPLVTPDRVQLVLSKKHRVAEILVGFSGDVDATEADSTATYRLAAARKGHSFTSRNVRTIRLRSATYDGTSDTVILVPTSPFARAARSSSSSTERVVGPAGQRGPAHRRRRRRPTGRQRRGDALPHGSGYRRRAPDRWRRRPPLLSGRSDRRDGSEEEVNSPTDARPGPPIRVGPHACGGRTP